MPGGPDCVDVGGGAGTDPPDPAFETCQNPIPGEALKYAPRRAGCSQRGGVIDEMQRFDLGGCEQPELLDRAQDRKVPIRQAVAEPLEAPPAESLGVHFVPRERTAVGSPERTADTAEQAGRGGFDHVIG